MSNKFLKFEINRPGHIDELDPVFISLSVISSIWLFDSSYAPSLGLALTITLTNNKHYARTFPPNTLLADAEDEFNYLVESLKTEDILYPHLYKLVAPTYVKFAPLTRECRVNFIHSNNIEVIGMETVRSHLPELEKFAIHIVMAGRIKVLSKIFNTREEAQEFLDTLLAAEC